MIQFYLLGVGCTIISVIIGAAIALSAKVDQKKEAPKRNVKG